MKEFSSLLDVLVCDWESVLFHSWIFNMQCVFEVKGRA